MGSCKIVKKIYYTLPLPGYMFRHLRVIIRPSNEMTQDYLTPTAHWDPIALTIVGATVTFVMIYASGVRSGGVWGVQTPPPPKFRRYRWSPRSHEEEEPACRFPFV